jgi:formylglycine-generating enzyme required for sulfatase activity
MRAYMLLREKGISLLQPEVRDDFQYELAALLCKSGAEQDTFHQIYKDFLKDLGEGVKIPEPPPEPEVPPKPPTIRELAGPLLFPLFLVLGLILLSVVIEYQNPTLIVGLPSQSVYYPGDTIRLDPAPHWRPSALQDSIIDPQKYEVSMEWVHLTNPKTEAIQVGPPYELVLPDSDPFSSRRELRVFVKNKERQKIKSFSLRSYDLNCRELESPGEILVDGPLEVGALLKIRHSKTLPESVSYSWEIDTLSIDAGKDGFDFRFEEEGIYMVNLTLKDTTASGYCEKKIRRSIRLDKERPTLASQDLVRDPTEPRLTYHFSRQIWALLLLFTALLIFSLWNWWNNRRQHQNWKPDFSEPGPLPDHPPYQPPVRSLSNYINTSPEQFQVANMLRQRQTGLRKQMDLPASIRQTVHSGGFPSISYFYRTNPTDYLFLVHQDVMEGHQVQLFEYLVKSLQQQDVHIDRFFFKNHLDRLWNEQHPEGLTLEQLARTHAPRRLVIFGTGHLLLDLHSGQLDPVLKNQLQKWKQRLLVTPQPVTSWTFQEARLYQLLPVFPGDLSGVLQAAAHVEAETDDEQLPPTFREWEEQIQRSDLDVDTKRRWKRWRVYEDYFKGQPDLLRWVKALAVYPRPTWNFTLAIGRGLGVPVTYDHLLQLARIPWINEGKVREPFRDELLSHLSPEDERLARLAVAEELRSLSEKARGSFAEREINIELAAQEFLLAPEDKKAQLKIRQYQQQGLLNRLQLKSLDRGVGGAQPGAAPGEALKEYLEESKLPELWNGWLVMAVISALLLLGSSLFFSQGDPRLFNPEEGLGAWLVDTREEVDSARYWNNLGVDIYTGVRQSNLGITIDWEDHYDEKDKKGLECFDRAERFSRGIDYPLPVENMARIFYNRAVTIYSEQPDSAELLLAAEIFSNRASISSDSTKLLGWHGAGLCYYELGNLGEACRIRNEILEVDSLFFAKQPLPNLGSLLTGCEGGVIIDSTEPPTAPEEEEAPEELALELELIDSSFLQVTVLNGTPPFEVRVTNNGEEVTLPATDDPGVFLIGLIDLGAENIFITVTERKSGATFTSEYSFNLPPPPPPIDPSEMITITGGTFTMGCTAEQGSDCFDSEKPAHEVTVGTFAMSKFELTKREYVAFLNEIVGDVQIRGKEVSLRGNTIFELSTNSSVTFNRGRFGINSGYEQHPANEVSWYGAIEYCNWLSRKENRKPYYSISGSSVNFNSDANGYRLPSEAEWEFAARGGNVSRGFKYAGSNDLDKVGWYDQNSGFDTHPIGEKQVNELELADMSGNVYEWTNDCWYDSYTGAPTNGGPWIGGSCSYRVFRGGSWSFNALLCRVSFRHRNGPGTCYYYVGFRLVLSL